MLEPEGREVEPPETNKRLIKNVLDKTKRNLGSSPFTKILASMRSTDAKRDIMSANASLRACQTRKTKILTGGIHNVFRELKFED